MVQSPERFEVEPPLERGHNWPALVASAAFHLLIVLLLLFGIPSPASPVRRLPPGGQAPQPVVFAMPQPKQPAARPRPPEPRPQPPPRKEQILGPDAKKPAEVPKQAAPTAPADQTPPATPTPVPAQLQQQPATAPPAAPQQAPTPSTSPLRIPRPGDYLGGRGIVAPTPSPFPPISASAPSSSSAAPREAMLGMGRLGMASPEKEHFENSFDDETQGTCVDVPKLGKNPDGSPVLAAVTGTVYEEDGSTPLPNAHLQIIGYPYSTFSDAGGKYRLEFDPSTLAHCRAQYVVVEAAGHKSQMLTLAIGPEIVSPPIIMKRR